MAVIWTTASYIYLISSIPMAIFAIFAFRYYLKTRYPYIFFHTMGWVHFVGWSAIQGLAYAFQSKWLFGLHLLLLIPLLFFWMLTFDLISRESVDPKKMFIIGCFLVAVLTSLRNPESIMYTTLPNGDFSMQPSEELTTIIAILVLYAGFMYFYYIWRIHVHCPEELKITSRFNLFGASLIAIVTPVVAIFELDKNFIPGLDAIVFSIGGFICMCVFIIHPKLAFVLPYKVHNLMIMQTQAGIPIYSYQWDKEGEVTDNFLFTGVLYAIRGLFDEALNKGQIKEIHLDKAILLIKYDSAQALMFVLVTSKSSKTLQTALTNFALKFIQTYRQELKNYTDIGQFTQADQIIQEIFSFVP